MRVELDVVPYPLLPQEFTCQCHGTRAACNRCGRHIGVGQPFSLGPGGVQADGRMVAEVLCVYCGPPPT